MRKMNLTILLTILMSMVGTKALAHDIEVNNEYGVTIYYNIINNAQELEVTYRGSSYDTYSDRYSVFVDIPEEVTYMGRTMKVTSIGQYAFYSCTDLISVTIPNSVTNIGKRAFQNCTRLTSVNILNNVTSIGDYAFSRCSALTSAINLNSVISIADRAFSHCTSLTSLTIGNSAIDIGEDSFSGCSGLTSLTIGNRVTNIGNDAFEDCSSLISVNIPESVTSIGSNAFRGCSGLTSVTIPNSVTSIGQNAFAKTPWFNNKPDGLVYIGKIAYKFKGIMPDNTSITIKDGTLEISGSAFIDCSGLASITIPNSVIKIGTYAFSGCWRLTAITIPNSVTSIGENAFNQCSGLTSVTIGNSVTSIGDFAFSYCSGLTSITIPNSVTSIGSWAFDGVDLTTVVSLIENPFTIDGKSSSFGAFSENTFNNATLYVPVGTIDKYKATNGWKDFAHIVEGDPTGIKNIETEQLEEVSYYGLDGKRIESPKSGSVVIKKSGQKAMKVLVK